MDSDCNGHISRVRPGSSEASGTRVLVYPLCLISSWNTETSSEMLSCPGLLLESKCPLYLSFYLYPSFHLSCFPLHTNSFSLESSCLTFSRVDPEWNILARRVVQVFTQNFPSFILCLIKYKSGGPKELLCWYRDIPIQPSYPNISYILSSFCWHADHFLCTVLYLVPYLTQRGTTFSCVLYQEIAYLHQTLPGETGVVDLLGWWIAGIVLGGFRIWSLTLHVSMN